jgi:WD40 repeat protein
MILPQQGSSSDSDVFYGHRLDHHAPCRDVSWHPSYPILASTSFDKTVKIWTLQENKSKFKI